MISEIHRQLLFRIKTLKIALTDIAELHSDLSLHNLSHEINELKDEICMEIKNEFMDKIFKELGMKDD